MSSRTLASRPSLFSAMLEQEARRQEALRQQYPSLDKLASALWEQKLRVLETERRRNPQLAAAKERLVKALRSEPRKEEQSVLELKRTRTVFETQELTVFRRKTA